MTAVDERLQALLASVPDPEKSARYLDCLRHDSPAVFQRIAESPAAARCAVTLFSYSRFLSDAVLRYPERLVEVAGSPSLYRVLTAEEYQQRLSDFLDSPAALCAVDLARFRRRQLLRIVLRDVLGVATLSDVTEELSNLADAMLDVAYRRIRADFVTRHGEPRLADGAPAASR